MLKGHNQGQNQSHNQSQNQSRNSIFSLVTLETICETSITNRSVDHDRIIHNFT